MLDENKVKLTGTIVEPPVYKYKNFGEKFYVFFLKVVRKSETADILPVLISDHSVDINALTVDRRVGVSGRMSGRKDKDTKRLEVVVFATDIELDINCKVDINEVILTGFTSKDIYFKSNGTRDSSDMLIASNRKYGKAEYIPVVAWGRNARFSRSFKLGTHISCVGRVQSRNFPKDTDSMIYEVSLIELELYEDEEGVSNGEKSTNN